MMICILLKSDHIVTNHGVNQQTENSTHWFQANGFSTSGLTSIRRTRSRKIYYNQIEGDLAHCSIFDMKNHVLLLNEAVMNGRTYKLIRIGEVIFLDDQGMSKYHNYTYLYTYLPVK